MFAYLLAAILLISLSGFYLGRTQATTLRSQKKLNSLLQLPLSVFGDEECNIAPLMPDA